MTTEQIFTIDTSVIDHARAVQLFRWVGVSAISFLVWDTIINIGDEVRKSSFPLRKKKSYLLTVLPIGKVELIWSQPKTWICWVYAYVRYFGVAGIASLLILNSNEHNRLGFSHGICLGWIIWEAFLTHSLLIFVEIVLLLRIYVLYDKNNVLLWILLALLTIETLILLGIAAYSIPRSIFSLELGCVVISAPPLNLVAWLAPMSFQTILFMLTTYRLFNVMKESRTLGMQSALFAFLRDGLWAYIVILVVTILNVLMFRFQDTPLAPLLFKWALCIVAFTGAHVMLNMRRIYARIPDTSIPTGLLTTAGDIEFCMSDLSGSSAYRSADES
ncbi:hypothetical protein QCA50_007055 [Cerrena zonata]|uniref:DUF6533 domain-containing protein n=1 Tax=Cerrena zonata TaxID=2478898 RepID=A0AAW0GD91_9APHY